MADPALVPIDYDPFAAASAPDQGATAASGPKLVPVDHDPFAAPPAGTGSGASGVSSSAPRRLSYDDMKTAPDGHQYLPDPGRPGQYLMLGSQQSPSDNPLVPVYHDPFAAVPDGQLPDRHASIAEYGAPEAIAHGATFGLSDQASNLGAASGDWLRDKTSQAYQQLTGNPVQSSSSFGSDYDRAAAETREAREAHAREHPYWDFAENVAGGLAGMLTGSTELGAASAGAKAAPSVLRIIGKSSLFGAGAGAVQGVSDTAGTDTASDVAKAGVTGGATGAVIGGALPAAIAGIGNTASWLRNASGLAFTQNARELAAGRQTLAAASDPVALQAAAAAPVSEQQVVPGSQPSLFQLSGDPGVGAYERSLATRNPAPFNQQRLAQTNAKISAMKDIGPESPDPDAVAAYARQQLAALDHENATSTARDLAATQQATSDTNDVLARRQAAAAQTTATDTGADRQATQQAMQAVPNFDPAASGETIRGDVPQRGQRAATTDVAPVQQQSTAPEPPGDLAAQITALNDPNHPKDAVFVANGNEDAVPWGDLSPRVHSATAPAGTLLTTDPAKAAYFQSKPNPDDADMAALLGYPVAKNQAAASGSPTVVQARDAAGNVVYESATHPAGMPATTRAAQEQLPPGGSVVTLSPEQALQRRQILIDAHANADTAAPNEGTAANPTDIQSPADIPVAERHVDANPTDAQIAAGNYQKGHATVQGIPVTIENPTGSVRSGVGADGKPWSSTLQNPYGYIKRTNGADGEQVDTYLGPNPQSPKAFVVDQHDPVTGDFDEHKAILGADTPQQAASIYDAGFSDGSGPSRRAGVNEMPVADFKDWLRNGDTTGPASETAPAAQTTNPASAQNSGGSGLAGARAESRAGPSNIFNALKAKNPALDVSPLADSAHNILAEKADSQQLMGDEPGIFGTVTNWPQVQSYKELQGIRERIGNAISADKAQPGGATAVSYRLGKLKDALDETVATAARRQATTDLAGVKAGTVAPEDTLYGALLREANDWKSGTVPAESFVAGADTRGGNGAPGNAQFGTGNVRSAPGGQGAPVGGSSTAPGNTGVPPEPLTPTWTDEYTKQYDAARSGWAQSKQTYDQGSVGKALASDGRDGYKLADEQVGPRLFNAGAAGQQDLEQAIAAIGHKPETMNAIQDYAASLLRNPKMNAVNPDGTINMAGYNRFMNTYGPRIDQLDSAMGDSGVQSLRSRLETAGAAQQALDATTVRTQGAQKLIDDMANKIRTEVINQDGTWRQGVYQNWLRQNSDRLAQFPDVAEKFNTASAAQATLDATQAAAKAARDAFQESAAAKFINTPDPVDTIGAMLSNNQAKSAVPQFVKQIGGDPDAVEGAKGLTMDWITKKFLRGPENEDFGAQSIRAEAYKNFVADKGGVLEGILGQDGVDTLRNISNDMSRNARSYTEAKLPAGPGTAQDIMGASNLNQPKSLAGLFTQGVTKGATGVATLMRLGLGKDIAVALGSALTKNNINGVNDIATRMVLDPQFASTVFSRIPPVSSRTAQMAWAQRVASAMNASTLSSLRSQSDQRSRIRRRSGPSG